MLYTYRYICIVAKHAPPPHTHTQPPPPAHIPPPHTHIPTHPPFPPQKNNEQVGLLSNALQRPGAARAGHAVQQGLGVVPKPRRHGRHGLLRHDVPHRVLCGAGPVGGVLEVPARAGAGEWVGVGVGVGVGGWGYGDVGALVRVDTGGRIRITTTNQPTNQIHKIHKIQPPQKKQTNKNTACPQEPRGDRRRRALTLPRLPPRGPHGGYEPQR